MKKTYVVFVAVLVLLLTACQTTKNAPATDTSDKKVIPEILPLDFSENGGKTLDRYWDSYFETGDSYYLYQIMAYVDSDDAVLAAMIEACESGTLDKSWLTYLGVEENDGIFTCAYDLDLLTVYFIENQDPDNYSEMILLYSWYLPDEGLLVRNLIKTYAFWSLASFCEENSDVRAFVEQRLPELSPKTQYTFAAFFDITAPMSEE